jgi:hypothetical protein
MILALASPVAAAEVEHIVLCWLAEPGNTEAAAEVIRVTRELESLPGVQGLVAGTPLPSERPIVDDSFDVGIVMRFADATALDAYLEHPEHVRRVEQTLRPLCGQVRVHDIQH